MASLLGWVARSKEATFKALRGLYEVHSCPHTHLALLLRSFLGVSCFGRYCVFSTFLEFGRGVSWPTPLGPHITSPFPAPPAPQPPALLLRLRPGLVQRQQGPGASTGPARSRGGARKTGNPAGGEPLPGGSRLRAAPSPPRVSLPRAPSPGKPPPSSLSPRLCFGDTPAEIGPYGISDSWRDSRRGGGGIT